MQIFISHSWKDKTTADRLANDLEGVVEVWIDTEQLMPGDSIQGVIDDALAGMDYMLLLWSRNSNASSNVAAEIDSAVMVKCHRVITNWNSDTGARRRATVEVFPVGSSSIFQRSMPMGLGPPNDGLISGEWRAFCSAFASDPEPDTIKPRTLARAVLRNGRVDRFIDRSVWGLK